MIHMDYYSELKHVKGTDRWFVDGVCGFCISDGTSKEEAVINAIAYILNIANNNLTQKSLYINRDKEIKFLCEQCYIFKE